MLFEPMPASVRSSPIRRGSLGLRSPTGDLALGSPALDSKQPRSAAAGRSPCHALGIYPTRADRAGLDSRAEHDGYRILARSDEANDSKRRALCFGDIVADVPKGGSGR